MISISASIDKKTDIQITTVVGSDNNDHTDVACKKARASPKVIASMKE